MDITVYDTTTKEYQTIEFSYDTKIISFNEYYKRKENYIKNRGKVVSAYKFMKEKLYDSKDVRYVINGYPETALDFLVYYLHSDSTISYIYQRQHWSEDLVESRTDWDSMKGYADDMADVIENVLDKILQGKVM